MIELKDVLINYHDSIRHIKTVELNANNLLLIRKNDPKNNGVGYLYLYEVYEMLGIPFNGDRNIGITTKSGDTWHNLYSPWISVKDRLPEEHGGYLAVLNARLEDDFEDGYDPIYVDMVAFNKDYPQDWPKEYILYWMPLPEPPIDI